VSDKASDTSTERHTDKGRPRTGSAGTGKAKSPTVKQSAAKPATGSSDRPLTASDYARTTSDNPSTTAVIPAVKTEREASSMSQTVAPAPQREETPEPTSSSSSMQLSESRSGRAATLRLSYVEPWSVTRMAFAISVALMIVAVVAAAIFWVVLDVTGVWDQVDGSVTSVLSDETSTFRITDYLGFGRLVGLSLVLSALNVVIMTVLATIAAHLYNLAAQLLGGFAMTYSSQD
jgi:nitrogen fixation-related uncharacterized protein